MLGTEVTHTGSCERGAQWSPTTFSRIKGHCLRRMVLSEVPLVREGLAKSAESSLLWGESFLSRKREGDGGLGRV